MSTKITRRPLNKGAPRFPSMQSQTQTEEGYIHRLVRAGTARGKLVNGDETRLVFSGGFPLNAVLYTSSESVVRNREGCTLSHRDFSRIAEGQQGNAAINLIAGNNNISER